MKSCPEEIEILDVYIKLLDFNMGLGDPWTYQQKHFLRRNERIYSRRWVFYNS